MSIATSIDHSSTSRPRRTPFGPVAAIILTLGMAILALAAAAFLAVFLAGMLDPAGPGAFLEAFGTDALPADAQVNQRFEGFMLFLWGPMLALAALAVTSLRRAGLRRQLAIGGTLERRPVLIAVGVAVVMIAVEAVLAVYYPALRELFTLPTDPMAMWLAIVGAVIGAPVAEELLFRGFLHTAIRGRWGARAAVITTSVIFAGMHVDETGMYALLVLPSGFLLGWLRERTGGIAAPVLIHALFNAAAVGSLLIERAL